MEARSTHPRHPDTWMLLDPNGRFEVGNGLESQRQIDYFLTRLLRQVATVRRYLLYQKSPFIRATIFVFHHPHLRHHRCPTTQLETWVTVAFFDAAFRHIVLYLVYNRLAGCFITLQ